MWLKRLGADVTGYSLEPPTKPSLFEICGLEKRINSVIGNIMNLDALCTVLDDLRPEIVFHLAAQSLVRYSYKKPVETLNTNIMGTVNVLEACRVTPSVRTIVIVTSDKCYENRESVRGYRENDPMGGYDPYSCSKGCAELVTAAYRDSFFNPNDFDNHGVALASVRAGNVIGGGDWAEDRLIPDLVRSIISGKPLSLRNPDAVRPWQHVLEPLHGYLMLAKTLFENKGQYAEPWNFGPAEGDCKPVQWVAERFKKLWNAEMTRMPDVRKNLHEAHYLKLDISKAQARLGWNPKWDLSKAVESTVAWYKAWHEKTNDMHQFSLKQIESYEESV